ncbi:MAG: prepilin-type N-terminal cleavage/methylation domain-containing protein [Acholeplasmataceae bacterium]|nr:prepilin-type N-terminal cleavage/methylation domain-containing protein [Acholeplasmataceae bacterium]
MYKKRGFTLVELIVVIAIIAILAAVSIVGFSSYIDSARFSNDTQLAAQMTTTLTNHLVLNPEDDLDAYQVRGILESYDEDLDFTPSASDTGFFYLEDANKIIAAKFAEAEGIIATELNGFNQTMLLRDQELDAGDYASPEEIFGAGSYLLTTEETPLAMVVSFVANMANSGSRIGADYQEALDAIDDFQSNLFARLFGQTLDEDLEAIVTDFIQSFNPTETLYVNNTGWATGATAGSAILQVVTTPGMSNIPEFNLDLSDAVAVAITFPSTIRTAEAGAMPDASFTSSITFKGDPAIQLEAGLAVTDVFGAGLGVPASILSTEALSLSIYVGAIEMVTTYSYDLSVLRNLFIASGITITGYRLEIDVEYPRNTRVYVYTDDGLVGYATPYIPSPFV